jgi:penicillin amidase
MFTLQYDLFSSHAQKWMQLFAPLLPDTPDGRLLKEWDCCYRADSRAAVLFERIYRALYEDVFGHALGQDVACYLVDETAVVSDYYANFDRVLAAEHSHFWSGDRNVLYRRAIDKGLTASDGKTWGEAQSVWMRHILFGGKMPTWLGFDRGPISLLGGRATVHQGQLFRSGDRDTSFAPSARMVTDLADDFAHTNLPGGASDRRTSRYYANDVHNWLTGRYKRLPHKT